MVDPFHLLEEAKAAISRTTSFTELEQQELEYLGRNGRINAAMQDLKTLSGENKKTYGQKMNSVKQEILQVVAEKRASLGIADEARSKVDVTLPGVQYPKGSLHMVTIAIEEITRIFEDLGFIRVAYPEVEYEFFSFDSLNIPPEHPARDDFETFFVNGPQSEKYGKMVMTPHTSNGQNREMRRLGKPPLRMINISRTYRPNWDVTHTPMFHQFEGMVIDKNINITHLKGTIEHFAKEFFGQNRTTRLRPFHFPFTEPSFEVDISDGIVTQSNNNDPSKADNIERSRLFKSGWLELGGSGMIHPNVLRAGGIDPDEYSGWAFGFGVERVMMMKEGIKMNDLRNMYADDIRFLEQFA